jgi:hypothetical protein
VVEEEELRVILYQEDRETLHQHLHHKEIMEQLELHLQVVVEVEVPEHQEVGEEVGMVLQSPGCLLLMELQGLHQVDTLLGVELEDKIMFPPQVTQMEVLEVELQILSLMEQQILEVEVPRLQVWDHPLHRLHREVELVVPV